MGVTVVGSSAPLMEGSRCCQFMSFCRLRPAGPRVVPPLSIVVPLVMLHIDTRNVQNGERGLLRRLLSRSVILFVTVVPLVFVVHTVENGPGSRATPQGIHHS